MKDADESLGFVLSSRRRKQVLAELGKRPGRPMELCRKLGLDTGNVARLLFQLEKKKLVKCLTPEKRSWRVYMVTDLGKRVLNRR